MFRKLKVLLFLVGLGTLCAGLAACASDTKPEEYEKQGYTISVSYNANGGSFVNRDGVTIVDMFNPTQYEKATDGKISIKLTDPVSEIRPSGSSSKITLTRSGYFYVGWYRERTVVTNANGKAVDDWGVELIEKEDGSYAKMVDDGKGGYEEEVAYPAYTYSGLWDFEEDRLEYSEDEGVVAYNLYAGWIPYFEFEYYYKNNGEWVMYDSSYFDWKTTNAEGSTTYDKDTIWLPDWKDGAMNYSYNYANGSAYEFPAIANATFAAAYTDEACTQQIKEELEHEGRVDYDTGTAINRIQKIYVQFDEGVRYKISTAQQLSSYGSASGYYEILADLDFEKGKISWPAALSVGTFTGKLYSAEGYTYTIRNVAVKYANASALQGGLFGSIAKEAELKNITFENISFDLAATGTRLRNTTFALFAGYIEEDAQISSVTVQGDCVFKIGEVYLGSGFSLNLWANGDKQSVNFSGDVDLVIYGTDLNNYFSYSILLNEDGVPDVTVDEDDNINLTFSGSYVKVEKDEEIDKSSFTIIYQEDHNE